MHEALDLALGRTVAVKRLRASARADRVAALRLEREARALAAVTHRHVCVIHEFVTSGHGGPLLVMERLFGDTLAARTSAGGRVATGLAVRVARELLSALATVHAAGVLHRDVKPENVVLATATGLPVTTKLVDFGSARAPAAIFAHADDELATASGHVVGTASYLSPEQASGAQLIDARSDLYQVGVLLYHTLSGRRPFEGASTAEVMRAVRVGQATPLSEVAPLVPPALGAVVARAMALSPDARFQSATHFQEALAMIDDVAPVDAQPHGDPSTAKDLSELATEIVARRT